MFPESPQVPPSAHAPVGTIKQSKKSKQEAIYGQLARPTGRLTESKGRDGPCKTGVEEPRPLDKI
ncbi:hypothetical protein GCM10010350_17130 [Streptomyces galilaeus]|nr:hypothetical protein GCM10010350_17130 [Streptomyces galilaeus]